MSKTNIAKTLEVNPHDFNEEMCSSKPTNTFRINEFASLIEPTTLLTHDECKKLIKFIFFVIAQKMREGYRVDIPYFGTFYPRYQKPRKAFNVHTQEKRELPARIIPCFSRKRMLTRIMDEEQYHKYKKAEPTKIKGLDALAEEYAHVCIGDDYTKYLYPEEFDDIKTTVW